jgi:hypothetical protein
VRQENDLTREAVQATIVGDGRRALEALDRGGGRVTELAEADDRRAAMAKDYVALSIKERERTLVMDSTRKGRELLTQAIRAELRKDGTLGKDSVSISALESKGLTREEARHARGYEVGDVVTFRRDYERHGIDKGQAYRVEGVDRDRNRIVLLGGRAVSSTGSSTNGAGGRLKASVRLSGSFPPGTGCSSPGTSAGPGESMALPRRSRTSTPKPAR